LVAHAAESRIDILVVRLEPVAKRAAKHARSGAGAAAFHYIVLAIEEVGGVSGIELEGLKAAKRRKWSRGPLPSVAQHVDHPESAPALREGRDGGGIPAFKIEISQLAMRIFRAPGIRLLGSLRRAVGGAMPLRFAGQRLPCPARICAGLG